MSALDVQKPSGPLDKVMGGIRGLWGTRLTENVQDDKADFQIDGTRTDLIGTERIKFNLKTHLRICMSEQLSAN